MKFEQMSCEEWKGPSLLWTSPGFQDSTLAVLSKCERTSVSSLLGFWKVFEQKASSVDGNFVYSQVNPLLCQYLMMIDKRIENEGDSARKTRVKFSSNRKNLACGRLLASRKRRRGGIG